METRSGTWALAAAAAVLLSAADASALDAYRDRRGLLYGASLGFGGSKADVEGADREIGVNLRGRVGGGVTETLTLDAELGLHKVFEDKADANVFTGMLGANLFLIEGVYVRAMAGMAHFSPKAGESQTGIGFGGGVGYEFFANSDLAIGGLLDYQQHLHDDFDVNVISFGVTATLY